MGVRVAATKHLDDVAHRGAVERGDDADLARQRRQRTLAPWIEESLALQPFLQLIEGQLPRAQALRLQMLADDLILALRVVDGDAPARHHAEAVFDLEAQIADVRAEHHRFDLRAGVLQREVDVSGLGDEAVRDLTLDPDLEESLLERLANPLGELRDGEDTTRFPGPGRSAILRLLWLLER